MNTKTSRLGVGLLMLLLTVCVVFSMSIFVGGCEYKLDDADEQTAQDTGEAEEETAQDTGEDAEAGPTISYSGVRDAPLFFPGPGASFDVNNDDKTDFRFAGRPSRNSWHCFPETGNAAVGPLSAGVPIDGQNPSSRWFSDEQYMVKWYATDGIPEEVFAAGGAWGGVTNRYMGLAFFIDGSTHYGWARISIPWRWHGEDPLTLHDGMHNMGTVHDWAYNTVAGQSIKAGATE